eukprot:Hpha_TRINITY_DN9164_c0_g1::TRINITY_DN9164_c0_g1_i1::g.94420::m.94420
MAQEDTIAAQGRRWTVDAELVEGVRGAAPVVEALRAADTRVREWCDDAVVRRFLRANIYNAPKAERDVIVKDTAEQLADTIEWRGEGPNSLFREWGLRPEDVMCTACVEKTPYAHAMRVVGTDKAGHAVAYTCYSQSIERWNTRWNTEHMLWLMEHSTEVLRRAGKGVTSWVWFIDFHGYHMMKDSSPASGRELAKVLYHYPETLHQAVLVDAPFAFNALWSVVKGMVNQHTASKVKFISMSKLRGTAPKWAGPELTNWLLAEIADNRKRVPPEKCWFSDPVDGHDARGTASFVRAGLYRPPPCWGGGKHAEECAPSIKCASPGAMEAGDADSAGTERSEPAAGRPDAGDAKAVTGHGATEEHELVDMGPPPEAKVWRWALWVVLWVAACCAAGAATVRWSDADLALALALTAVGTLLASALLARCCCRRPEAHTYGAGCLLSPYTPVLQHAIDCR